MEQPSAEPYAGIPFPPLAEISYRFPMTVTQQAFWYLDRLRRGNPAWNIAVRFEVAGPLDPARLQAAVDLVVARQDALRTTFSVDLDDEGADAPVQTVHEVGAIPVRLAVDELALVTGATGETPSQAEYRLTVEEAQAGFVLERGPLLRVRLLRRAPLDHLLLLTVHHIIADGWSIGILAEELTEAYAALADGREARLAELPIQFADYAVWVTEQARASASGEARRYWKQKLVGIAACEVPLDFPRPEISANRGEILSRLLPEPLTDRLAERAREHGATLFAASLAALQLLLARACRCSDISVGTLVAGRDRPELESLVGVFVNTLVLRSQVAQSDSWSSLVSRARATVEEAIAHQAMPFSELMTSLRLKTARGCSHFYSINFIYQRDFVKPWQGAGLTVTALPSRSAGAIYDLNFFMVRRADGWRFSCEYDCELYRAETVSRLLDQFEQVLKQVTEDPGRTVEQVRL